MDVYVIRYWWITCGWNINRIKWMGSSAESQILGRRNAYHPWDCHIVRIHLVDLYGKLVGINIPIPWIPWVRDKEWFLLKRKNSRSCTYKYLRWAVSPHLRQARREPDVAIRVDPVGKFVEIMSHIAIDLPSTASGNTPRKDPLNRTSLLFWDHVIYHLISCVCFWKGNHI